MKWVKISNKKPPQWILSAVKEKWNVNWESTVIFTYEEMITSFGGEMTEDLIAHEQTHVRQQLEHIGGADAWWQEYLTNDKFRFGQELEAYRNQYQWLIKYTSNKEEIFKYWKHYAKSLSGEMYGNMVDYWEAMRLIKNVDK